MVIHKLKEQITKFSRFLKEINFLGYQFVKLENTEKQKEENRNYSKFHGPQITPKCLLVVFMPSDFLEHMKTGS